MLYLQGIIYFHIILILFFKLIFAKFNWVLEQLSPDQKKLNHIHLF